MANGRKGGVMVNAVLMDGGRHLDFSTTRAMALRSPHLKQWYTTAHTGCPSNKPSCGRWCGDGGKGVVVLVE